MELQITEKDGKFTLDTAALESAIKTGTVEAVKDQVKSSLQEELKTIFPDSQGKNLGRGGSIIDTSFFKKGLQQFTAAEVDGKDLPFAGSVFGGPFKSLSPAMEKFAEAVRCRFDANRLYAKGINIDEYNKEIAAWNYKDVHTGLTRTDGGALVPIEFLATVIEFATAESQILPKLWRVPMGAPTMRIPTLAQSGGSYFGGVLIYHPEELELKSETKPVFSYKEFTAHKMAALVPISDEMIADSSINIINYVTAVITRAFRYKIEGEVLAGTGLNGQMLGITQDPSVNLVARQTVGQVKYDDILNLESALDENFQDLTWMTRRATVNYLRKQKDTVGQPVYRDTVAGMPQVPTILDYPIIKTRNVPLLGLKGDVILGDLGYYIWAVKQDMTIDMSKDYLFAYDATTLRFVMRMDGKPGVSIAFSELNSTPES